MTWPHHWTRENRLIWLSSTSARHSIVSHTPDWRPSWTTMALEETPWSGLAHFWMAEQRKVLANGCICSKCPVPQGSALWPTLFLLFINSIIQKLNSKTPEYGSLQMIASFTDNIHYWHSCSLTGSRLIMWSHPWQMSFNSVMLRELY